MRARSVLAAFAALAALTGCGIPVDDAARPLSADEVPSSRPRPTPAPAPRPGDPPDVEVEVFFVRELRLAPVRRPTAPPPSVDDALATLLAGPTPAERSEGLRTALTRDVRLAGTFPAGVPLIDITETFAQTEAQEQILALAQIVFSVTSLPGVSGVSFALEGHPVDVPTGDGTLKQGPLRREDYAAVAAVPAAE